MRGTIVLNNFAGRTLRRGAADVHARDVLDCIGGFAAGDAVYLTFRAVDGGQYVVASGVSRRSDAELRHTLQTGDASVVVSGQDVRLLW